MTIHTLAVLWESPQIAQDNGEEPKHPLAKMLGNARQHRCEEIRALSMQQFILKIHELLHDGRMQIHHCTIIGMTTEKPHITVEMVVTAEAKTVRKTQKDLENLFRALFNPGVIIASEPRRKTRSHAQRTR